MSALAKEIEEYLLRREGWVGTGDLCLIFHVDARALRAQGDKPGLCSDFAISGPLGFRHIKTCTDTEWLSFSERLNAHGLSELRRISTLRARREGIPAPRQEVHDA